MRHSTISAARNRDLQGSLLKLPCLALPAPIPSSQPNHLPSPLNTSTSTDSIIPPEPNLLPSPYNTSKSMKDSERDEQRIIAETAASPLSHWMSNESTDPDGRVTQKISSQRKQRPGKRRSLTDPRHLQKHTIRTSDERDE